MFAILKQSRNSPNKFLANINEFTVYSPKLIDKFYMLIISVYDCSTQNKLYLQVTKLHKT